MAISDFPVWDAPIMSAGLGSGWLFPLNLRDVPKAELIVYYPVKKCYAFAYLLSIENDVLILRIYQI